MNLSFGLDDWDVEVEAHQDVVIVSARTETKYGLAITYTPVMVVSDPELVTVAAIKQAIVFHETMAGGLV